MPLTYSINKLLICYSQSPFIQTSSFSSGYLHTQPASCIWVRPDEPSASRTMRKMGGAIWDCAWEILQFSLSPSRLYCEIVWLLTHFMTFCPISQPDTARIFPLVSFLKLLNNNFFQNFQFFHLIICWGSVTQSSFELNHDIFWFFAMYVWSWVVHKNVNNVRSFELSVIPRTHSTTPQLKLTNDEIPLS